MMSAPSARSSSTSRRACPAAGGGVHLIGPAVAELGRAFGRFAKRAVKAAGVLGGVAQDRHVREAAAVEGRADGADHAVHHAAGSDQVGPGLGVADGLLAEQLQRGVVVDVHPAGVIVDRRRSGRGRCIRRSRRR